MPSDYFDQWLEEIYCPEHIPALKAQFGCPNMPNGTIVDCYDKLDRYLTSTIFGCNSRFAFNGEGLRQKGGQISLLLPSQLANFDESYLFGHNITRIIN